MNQQLRDLRARYDELPGINFSKLKHIWSDSPKHFRWIELNGRADTEPFAFGRLLHAMVLEPESVCDQFSVEPRYADLRTNAGKAERTAWRAGHASQQWVSAESWALAKAMAESVRLDSVACKYVTGEGVSEYPLLWTEESTGLACKGRLDRVTPTHLVGLKSVAALNERQFASSAHRYGYHLQWAFYSDGWELKHTPLPTVEIVVEKRPPFDVLVYNIPTEVIEFGRSEYQDALRLLKSCQAFDSWPGFSGGHEREFALPKYAQPYEGDLSEVDLDWSKEGSDT